MAKTETILETRLILKRAREIIRDLPESTAYYPPAYFAYLDEKDKEAVQWLEKYAGGSDPTDRTEPFSADELYWEIVLPFTGSSREFWCALAESIVKLWSDSPAALTLAGYVKQDENKPEDAFAYYERALRADKDYWLAAWGLGEVNLIQKNWQAALQYYEKSLASETARTIPQISFDSALCAGKLDDHITEEKHYRACLELDPDYRGARNNLGWALYKQHRFAEALAVFDECIARKVDGAYPRRNRARALARLGRLSEAIDAWKQTGHGGRLSKHAQEQIAKLKARINSGEVVQDDEDDGDDGIAEGERGKARGN
ncbi:MAG: tetratricopeptide repeat protein [Candidatus Binatia bacterium]